VKRLALLVLLLVVAVSAFSLNFGLLVNQTIEADNDLFTYTPALTPWFSWNNGSDLSVYLSGLLSFQYSKYSDDDLTDDNGWMVIPELYRFAADWRINREMRLEAGRIPYTDVMGFTAYGFFDGARFTMAAPFGSISAGIYYSGLLYKKTAIILMTGSDRTSYAASWGFDSFADYFASRRALAALRWDMPVGEAIDLSAEFLAQFDLNDGGDKLHSQYGEVQVEYYPVNMLRITAAALFEIMQNGGGNGAAFGVLAQAQADLPGSLNDKLGLSVRFTSGPMNDTLGYTPISSITQSAILSGMFAGLAIIGVDYNIRILNTLYAEGALRYFIRAYDDPAAGANSVDAGALYGGELWASFVWQPLEDTRATFGAGAFFPGLGNIYPSGTDLLWKVSASVIISL